MARASDCLRFAPYVQFDSGAQTTGIDLGDFDHDGDIDLALSNRDSNDVSVLLNTGSGVYAPAVNYPVGLTPRYVFAADFDGDTFLDLATSDWDGHTVTILLNNGDGTFRFHASIPGFRASWLAIGDVDGDGDQDIFLTKWDEASPSPSTSPALMTVILNDGLANFTEGQSKFIDILPRSGAVGDFDNDGDLDFVATHLGTFNLSFLENIGNGMFNDAVNFPVNDSPRYITAADLDGDLDLDLAVVHKVSNDLWILRNDGTGSFSIAEEDKYPTQINPHGVISADLDGDGDLELVVTSVGIDRLDIFNNEGGGFFTSQTALSPGASAHVALDDLDGDGAIDIAIATAGTGFATLHFNQSPQVGPPWTDVSSPELKLGYARGAAWGDFDKDGDIDLYVTKWGEPNKLFRNDGLDTFTDISTPTTELEGGFLFSGRAIWGDHDNDGDLDLYVAQSKDSHLLRNDGAQGFVDVTFANPLGMTGRLARGVAWGDYDGDHFIDLYVGSTFGSNNASRLIHNDGHDDVFDDVTFATDPIGDSGVGRGVAWCDYDNDGDLDLYVANGGASNGVASLARRTNHLYRNEGGGVFVDVTSGPLFATGNSRGCAWGDYDNDGDFDLYITAIPVIGTVGENGENKLLRNDGAGVFTDVTTGLLGYDGFTRCVSWVDYDNDGDLDLYLVNINVPNMLLENDGIGGFADVASDALLGNSGDGNSAAWADYDKDGDMDVFICYGIETDNLLVRNDLQICNNWLEVKLVGSISNRSAIGARLTLLAGGVSQMRQIESGSGYFAQHMLTAHFGLGSLSAITSLTVDWPSGKTSVINAPAMNQILTVLEPCVPGTECPDCNANGVSDVEDLASLTSEDCNWNNVPDECEPFDDCNVNGIADICDVGSGAETDCNENGILDVCDLMANTSSDCNQNLLPDDCEYIRFPLTITVNTTADLDSRFTGPPDSGFGGLAGSEVVLFLDDTHIDDGAGPDFNVYENVGGLAEFDNIDVLVSYNGTSFISVKATEGAKVDIPGDGHSTNSSYVRSYDLTGSSLTLARWIKIVGASTTNGTNGFDLDSVGLVNGKLNICRLMIGDFNIDGTVNVTDLLLLLGSWGICVDCPEDINLDGSVNVSELLIVLANWG